MNILFICLGNICRSPLAEEVFRQKVKQAHLDTQFPTIDSAGMIDYHEGEPSDGRMRSAAAGHGLHLTHLSRPMLPADFHRFDLIVAMDADNLRRLRQMAPRPECMERVVLLSDYLTRHPGYESIPDPYYGDARDFELVIDLCDDACGHLLETLRSTMEK